jgi:1,2-phenylacetyl-CoA epoxidase PaaB subunit
VTTVAKKPKKEELHLWNVYRIKGTPAKLIGSVYAADREKALLAAFKEFGVTDSQAQSRIFVQRG